MTDSSENTEITGAGGRFRNRYTRFKRNYVNENVPSALQFDANLHIVLPVRSQRNKQGVYHGKCFNHKNVI